MSTHKLQLYVSDAVKTAAESLAVKLGKKPADIYRDAIAVYLVAQGELANVSDAYIAKGLRGQLSNASPSEKKRLQAQLRARMKKAREALAARRAEKKRQLAAEHEAAQAKLQSYALKLKRTLS